MKYLLIIAHDDQFRSSPELVESIHAWIEEYTRKGIRLVGAPLKPPNEAITIAGHTGTKDIRPGPFTTPPLHTAAFEMIECENIDQAVEVAQTHPMADRASVEVRPIWPELERINA